MPANNSNILIFVQSCESNEAKKHIPQLLILFFENDVTLHNNKTKLMSSTYQLIYI